MGKRRTGGGSTPLQIRLRRLVESYRSRFSTPEDLVTHFRATLPEYHRMKRQTLLRSVQRALQSIPKPNNIPTLKHLDDDDEEVEGRSTSRKRRRETDEREEGSQNMEAEVQNDPSTSSSAPASDGEVGALSTATSEEDYAEEMKVELEVANTPLVNGGKSEKKPLRVSVNWNEREGPRLKDLGGMAFLDELMTGVIVPLYLGLKPMAGILLHGPPGCGKTKLAHAIANETGIPLYSISATDVVSGVSGDSEKNIRELFSKACKTAPSIVFIDEIDAIASKRENLQRETDKRIVTQLITSMNDLSGIGSKSSDENSPLNYVLVIGATNRPDAIDPALRRPMRFDHEFAIGIPDESSREEILTVFTRNLRLEGSFDLTKIARLTSGFVGADLEAVVNKAVGLATKEIIDERKHELSEDPDKWRPDRWRQPRLLKEIHNKHAVQMSHFEEAVKLVQPSLTREGFSSSPNINLDDDVGGLDSIRRELERGIVRRIKYPEYYEKMGMDHERGFLLYGPPGCGKTLIAQAVANEAGVNFIRVKGPELLNKYVGESELAIRTLFSRARTCAPCILFFDEVDALTTKHSREGGVTESVLKQLLVELDGGEPRLGVFVIGATNKPHVMDPAALRPGRFGNLLYVPLPTREERVFILKALARKKPVDASVDLSDIARSEACENLSGADLVTLMDAAANAAIEEMLTSTETTSDTFTIMRRHFEIALSEICPSVTKKERRFYDRLSRRLKAA